MRFPSFSTRGRPRAAFLSSGALLIFVFVVASCASSGDSSDDKTSGDGDGDGALPSVDDTPWEVTTSGVFVHLFEWPWPDIAEECETVLGPSGYRAVQVSPPAEHAKIAGRPWWERYQPVSYELVSRSGTREEFVDMVERCHTAGVDVYVDAVLNHMSAQANGTGTAGTTFTKYNFPDWTPEDFHSPSCDIQGTDYASNATAVRECELLGLADLNTGAENVRQRLADHMAELVNLGVRGFRIDAAKHMAPEDIAAILALVEEQTSVRPYVFLEVIDPGGEAISEQEYAGIHMGDHTVSTTEFRYLSVGSAFRAGTVESLADLDPQADGLMESSRALVFTDNHDTQRGQTISYRDGRAHELANIFVLGFPYGYPSVMSSFSFTLPGGEADSPPHVGGDSKGPYDAEGSPCVISEGDAAFDRNTLSSLEDGRWVCEHRSLSMRAMVKFRAATEGAPVVHLQSSGAGSVSYAREGKGFVLINGGADTLSTTLPTTLPAGTYCNLLETATDGTCESASEFIVEADGSATFEVPAEAAIVLLGDSE